MTPEEISARIAPITGCVGASALAAALGHKRYEALPAHGEAPRGVFAACREALAAG
ncbi:MAG: hypothetical protein IT514_06710 [Burkholderiales bacterium]|nr:hypothetical protein [Burkholderiales bacterium]